MLARLSLCEDDFEGWGGISRFRHSQSASLKPFFRWIIISIAPIGRVVPRTPTRPSQDSLGGSVKSLHVIDFGLPCPLAGRLLFATNSMLRINGPYFGASVDLSLMFDYALRSE